MKKQTLVVATAAFMMVASSALADDTFTFNGTALTDYVTAAGGAGSTPVSLGLYSGAQEFTPGTTNSSGTFVASGPTVSSWQASTSSQFISAITTSGYGLADFNFWGLGGTTAWGDFTMPPGSSWQQGSATNGWGSGLINSGLSSGQQVLAFGVITGSPLTNSNAMSTTFSFSLAGLPATTSTSGLTLYFGADVVNASGTVVGELQGNTTLLPNIASATPPVTLTGTTNNTTGTTLTNIGTITNSSNSTLTNSGTLDNSAGTTLNNDSGATLTNNGTVTNGTGSTINNSGTLANAGTLDNSGVTNNSGTLSNTGTINNSGTLNTATIFTNAGTYTGSGNAIINGDVANNGTMNLTGTTSSSGNQTVYGSITNSGSVTVSNANLTVNGTVTNSQAIQVTNANLTYNGTFTNNGAYISDPSTQQFTNLIIGTSGYILAGAGDTFLISGDFTSTSTNPLWDTSGANLEFNGIGTQDFSFIGTETWNALTIDQGSILDFSGGNALYVGTLQGLDIIGGVVTNIEDPNGGIIYYDAADNSRLDGQTFELSGGGCLEATPEPATMLLFGVGLAGLAGWRFRRNRA